MLNFNTDQGTTEAKDNLTQRLSSFTNAPVSSVTPDNPITGALTVATEDGLIEAEAEAEEQTEATAETEEVETEDNNDDSAFGVEFENNFGIKVSEARDLIDNLSAFQQEVSLMREWQVTPAEYDKRISQVKEFYNTLPEEGREQFNTREGAVAIWEHLQKTNPATKVNKPNQRRTANNLAPAKSKAPQFDYKRSDILKMTASELQKNWSQINQAYINNRILEDA